MQLQTEAYGRVKSDNLAFLVQPHEGSATYFPTLRLYEGSFSYQLKKNKTVPFPSPSTVIKIKHIAKLWGEKNTKKKKNSFPIQHEEDYLLSCSILCLHIFLLYITFQASNFYHIPSLPALLRHQFIGTANFVLLLFWEGACLNKEQKNAITELLELHANIQHSLM